MRLRVHILIVAGLTLFATAVRAQFTFSHLAGHPGGLGSADGTTTEARFHWVNGMAADAAGNIYVADSGNHTIRKVSPAGVATTLAGRAGFWGSSDGTGAAARFRSPDDVAVDGAGNVYVTDSANHTIRKITPAGVVTTIAGVVGEYGNNDGPALSARFDAPFGIAVDAAGTRIYVTDGDSRIRKITGGNVSTVTSTGAFTEPRHLTIGADGNVYFTMKSCQCVQKMTPAGATSLFAGTSGVPGSADGGPGTGTFSTPDGLAFGADGYLYVADSGNHKIRRVDASGVISTVAGNGTNGHVDGAALSASFSWPADVAFTTSGALIIAEDANATLRRLEAGNVTTWVGVPGPTFGAVDATGDAARFRRPYAIAFDAAGNLIVADGANHIIRKVTSAGVTTTIAGSAGVPGTQNGDALTTARFFWPAGLALDPSGNIYVSDQNNHTIRKIDPFGNVTTFAGMAGASGSTDANGTSARFHYPFGLAYHGGSLYVADWGNHKIRRIAANGDVTTFAGSGVQGAGDGAALTAQFKNPVGIAVDATGTFYVIGNNAVRMIAGGVVSTHAGVSGVAGKNDGTGAQARFFTPQGIAVDAAGLVYVTDGLAQSIRTIDSSRLVTTITGDPDELLPGMTDGDGADARFHFPAGLAFGPNGILAVADQYNHAIRIGRAVAAEATIDSATGVIGATRQLGTSQAVSGPWKWQLVRRPSTSSATLSSTTTTNPTFTPDVADRYLFRLEARNGNAVFVSHVSLVAYPPKTATTTVVMTSKSPSEWNESVTFTATVTPAAATGDVVFTAGNAELGRITLAGGVASLATQDLAAATHSIRAAYVGGDDEIGDATHAPSTSSAISQVVQRAVTVTSLQTSWKPEVTLLTAIVTSPRGTPTGTVTFTLNGTTLGTAAVLNGVATLTSTTLAPGTHSVGASYGGDSRFAGSTAAARTLNTAPTGLAYEVVVRLEPRQAAQSILPLADGSILGTHWWGVFRHVPNGAGGYDYRHLYTFPIGGATGPIVAGNDGHYYFADKAHGLYSKGAIWRIHGTTYAVSVVHSFATTNGYGGGPLFKWTDGFLYGTTEEGGANFSGTLYRFNPATGQVTHLTAHATGAQRLYQFVLGTDGSMYGTQTYGLLRVHPSTFAIETLVPNIAISDLTVGPDGHFYVVNGTFSGINNTVQRIHKDTFAVTTLATFPGGAGGNGGYTIRKAGDGHLYGTASGGPNECGTPFAVTPCGVAYKFDIATSTISTVHPFARSTGGSPPARFAVATAPDGTIWGATIVGGQTAAMNGATGEALGSVFRIAGGTLTHVTSMPYLPSAGTLERGTDGHYYTALFLQLRSDNLKASAAYFPRFQDMLGFAPGNDGSFYVSGIGRCVAGFCQPDFVFRFNPAAATLTELHNFGLVWPTKVVQRADGSLLGTTREGGNSNMGTVFRLVPGSAPTTLHHFSAADGGDPRLPLIDGKDGHYYGMTTTPPVTFYRLNGTTLTVSALRAFTGTETDTPIHSLMRAADGHFYGTRLQGGAWGLGDIVRIDGATYQMESIYSFSGPDGTSPPELRDGGGGVLYGTTLSDGRVPGVIADAYVRGGTVFRFDASQRALRVLHTFEGSADGVGVGSPLVGADGFLYGGADQVVYRLRPAAGVISPPASITATATSPSQVSVTWPGVAAATTYEVQRSTTLYGGWTTVAITSSTGATDTQVLPNQFYFYKVRAFNAAGLGSAFTAPDITNTLTFTDDPIVGGNTRIKAVHLSELQAALNAFRAATSFTAFAFTSASSGQAVKPLHVTEMRNSLSSASFAMRRTLNFTDPSINAGSPVKGVHWQQIRAAIK